MKARAVGLLAVVAAAIVGCVQSPEAARVRAGGPGADVGNRGAVVQMHGGSKMYYGTPCRTAKVRCSGPAPVFGT
ncbi:MAG TPA: hypothetical protein VNI61_11575 [Gemmatimonadales bacterium]|nr:hypothetical protein [Gemmatimonadales bacterium]